MKQSARSGRVKIRVSFDNDWACFSDCRIYKEMAEGTRILSAFVNKPMFAHVVETRDREAVQRLAKALACERVTVPVVGSLVVLATAPLGSGASQVLSRGAFVRNILMKKRWKNGSLSATQGFLPPARPAEFWEAYHPSTGRRCFHLHPTVEEAAACVARIGPELDGSTMGWRVRGTSEWRSLGTLRVATVDSLVESARECGLDVTLHFDGTSSAAVRIDLPAVDWDDHRFVRFREKNRWHHPQVEDAQFRPPIGFQAFSVDAWGRLTGS